ncbi:MAG: hypothetical protein GY882_01930 [Actinomycetia bacterium]|nr:hypothetical protein [Actinomycetes bacterium]
MTDVSAVHQHLAASGDLPRTVEAWMVKRDDGVAVDALCQNPCLSEETWFELVTAKPTVDGMYRLLETPMPVGGLEAILTSEKRVKVLEHLAARSLTIDQALLFAEKTVARKGGSFRVALVEQLAALRADADNEDRVDEINEAVRSLWERMTALQKLVTIHSELADPKGPALSDEMVLGFLKDTDAEFEGVRKFADRNRLIKNILGLRPDWVSALVMFHQEALETALAGCVSLTELADQAELLGIDAKTGEPVEATGVFRLGEFGMLALVSNPSCHPEVLKSVKSYKFASWRVQDACGRRKGSRGPVLVPWDEITDPETLSWLVTRASSSTYYDKYRPPRAADLMQLVTNPHLSDDQLRAIGSELSLALAVQGFESLKALGPVRWAKVHLTIAERLAGPVRDGAVDVDRGTLSAVYNPFSVANQITAIPVNGVSGVTAALEGMMEGEMPERIHGQYHWCPFRAGSGLRLKEVDFADPTITEPSDVAQFDGSYHILAANLLYGFDSVAGATNSSRVWRWFAQELVDLLGDDLVYWDMAIGVASEYAADHDRTFIDVIKVVKRLRAASTV